jgi:hypothetical protein
LARRYLTASMVSYAVTTDTRMGELVVGRDRGEGVVGP